MAPEEFKHWRSSLHLTQVQAGELLGVTRVTIQNWENDVTRIPVSIDAACEIHRLRYRMRDDFGPVTLTYFDAPLWKPAYGPATVPQVSRELYPNNAAAIERLKTLKAEAEVHNPMIIDESGEMVWTSARLEEKCGGSGTIKARSRARSAT